MVSNLSNQLEKTLDDLEHQKSVANELSSQIQAHQNDSSLWTFWAATTRDPSGRLEGEFYGNGYNTKRTFDPCTGEILSIKTGVAEGLIRSIAYTYNNTGSVQTRSDDRNNINESFAYDSMDRLTSWSYLGADQSITRQQQKGSGLVIKYFIVFYSSDHGRIVNFKPL